MKFVDFFSGAGMFRMGMELAGHKCVGYCEINKYARETYEANYNTNNEWKELDVTQIQASQIPKADIWCFGFPCKNMSTANSTTRTGLNGKDSGLFLTMCDLLKNSTNKPKYLFVENVKGFTTINGGRDFLIALCKLHQLGYDIEYEISSAMKYGVPQNRIRTYLICTYNNASSNLKGKEIFKKSTISANELNIHTLHKYILNNNENVKITYGVEGIVKNGICSITKINNDKKFELKYLLQDILELEVDEKYYLNEEQLKKIQKAKGAKTKVLSGNRVWKEG